MGIDVAYNVAVRPILDDMNVSQEVLERLHKMLYENGPGNGTFFSLPFDQDVEHGPHYMFRWNKKNAKPEDVRETGRGCADPRSVIDLANRGNFSAIVVHPGIARKYTNLIKIPVIYKIDAHMTTKESAPTPATIGSIDDAKDLKATAIGTSFYPGSVETREDMERVSTIIRKAHNNGLPAVVWSYARGPGIFEFRDSLYCVSYAVTVAESLGADIIKTKFPRPVEGHKKGKYIDLLGNLNKKLPGVDKYIKLEETNKDQELTVEEHLTYRMKLVVDAAPRTIVVVSGGPKVSTPFPKRKLVDETRIIMNAGAEGRIIGRNLWGRPTDPLEKSSEITSLEITKAITEVMKEPQYHRRPSKRID